MGDLIAYGVNPAEDGGLLNIDLRVVGQIAVKEPDSLTLHEFNGEQKTSTINFRCFRPAGEP